jgi:hypothetical protein
LNRGSRCHCCCCYSWFRFAPRYIGYKRFIPGIKVIIIRVRFVKVLIQPIKIIGGPGRARCCWLCYSGCKNYRFVTNQKTFTPFLRVCLERYAYIITCKRLRFPRFHATQNVCTVWKENGAWVSDCCLPPYEQICCYITSIVNNRPYNIYNLVSRWRINRTTFHMSVTWKFDKVIYFFFYISIIFMDKS